MQFHSTTLPGVILIEPLLRGDHRGFFMEVHHRDKFAAGGIDYPFVQDNHTGSERGTLRGLHYQHPYAQGKLVRAIRGEIWDVAVDVRRDSPTFGQWLAETLSEANRRMLFIPPGFAHGFCVTSDWAEVVYKCTDLYHPETEHTILWNDPYLSIPWPVAHPLLSAKDAAGKPFSESTFF